MPSRGRRGLLLSSKTAVSSFSLGRKKGRNDEPPSSTPLSLLTNSTPPTISFSTNKCLIKKSCASALRSCVEMDSVGGREASAEEATEREVRQREMASAVKSRKMAFCAARKGWRTRRVVSRVRLSRNVGR